MRPKQSLYRHRFTHFTDALVPVYDRLFEVPPGASMGRFVSTYSNWLRWRVVSACSTPAAARG